MTADTSRTVFISYRCRVSSFIARAYFVLILTPDILERCASNQATLDDLMGR